MSLVISDKRHATGNKKLKAVYSMSLVACLMSLNL